MPQEEDFRQLQAEAAGLDTRHDLEFQGRRWPLARTGDLVALLRYASLSSDKAQSGDGDGAGDSDTYFAATYRILQDCIETRVWPDFERAAINGKATQQDVLDAVKRLFEVYTARRWHGAIRLLSWVVGNIGELDGRLLVETGQGMAHCTARQVCNIAYHIITAGLENDEQRAEFAESLAEEEDSEQRALQRALAMIREKAEANGEAPPADAPPVPPPPMPDDPFEIDLDS